MAPYTRSAWDSRGSSAGSSGWSRAPSTRPSAADSSPSRSVTGSTRVLDAGRTLGVSGRPVAPNNIGVYLSPADFERFESFAEALARELAEAARQHAREEGYQFVGPGHRHPGVRRHPEDGRLRRRGRDRRGRGRPGRARSCCPTAAGSASARTPPCIGRQLRLHRARSPTPAPRGSHAEIRATADGFLVVDLGSMNGTLVNGVAGAGARARTTATRSRSARP